MNRDDTAPLGGVAALSANCTTLTIALDGALDLNAAGTLECLVDGAAASGATHVRFDLTDLTSGDAAGLRLLERAAADITALGATVTVRLRSGAVTSGVRIGHAA